MGKAYANKKTLKERPEGDFYPTPKSLIWVAKDIIEQEFDKNYSVLEPCCGNGSISNELIKFGYNVVTNDLYKNDCNYKEDYLKYSFNNKYVITNPPFSLWDNFVLKAKSESDKVLMIGRLNYLGTHSRNINNIWNNLKSIYCFDRYIDYRTPERDDGNFHVGAMSTAWFLWEKKWSSKPTIEILSVQKYATLGNK